MKRSLASLALVLVAGAALAQGPRFADAPRAGTTARMQAEHVQQTRQHTPSQLGSRMRGALHQALGLTEDEIHARKEAGASIAGIGEELGIDRDTLESAYLEARSAAIAALRAADAVSELRAERMQARGPEVFAHVVDREGLGGGQHLTGEPHHAQRSEVPRGPRAQAADAVQLRMTPMQRGPHGRRSD
jgi:hypothetical protein